MARSLFLSWDPLMGYIAKSVSFCEMALVLGQYSFSLSHFLLLQAEGLSLDLFKDVSIANSLGGQRQSPPTQRSDLFAVQHNKDNVSLRGKEWQICLQTLIKYRGFCSLGFLSYSIESLRSPLYHHSHRNSGASGITLNMRLMLLAESRGIKSLCL